MKNFAINQIIKLLLVTLLIFLNGCATTSKFTITSYSNFSPNYNLNIKDKIFLTNSSDINKDDLTYLNIKSKAEVIFKELGYDIVNDISKAKYLVEVSYNIQPIDKVGGGAIPQFQNYYIPQTNIVGGATKNNFFIHGFNTYNQVSKLSGFQTYTYHYTEYANIVGLNIFNIIRNKKKISYENIGAASGGWTSSSPNLLQNLNLAGMVLKDLLISKPLSFRNYTFIWEDNILKSFTWSPINL